MSELAKEFITRSRSLLTSDCLPKIERCLENLSDEQVWWRANPESNSIGNLLLHLSGNARQWFTLLSYCPHAIYTSMICKDFNERQNHNQQ